MAMVHESKEVAVSEIKRLIKIERFSDRLIEKLLEFGFSETDILEMLDENLNHVISNISDV